MGAVVVFLCLVPLLVLGYDVATELATSQSALGADPGEAIVHILGEWTIRMLLGALTISSAARLLRRPRWIRFRRTLGLAAFGYGCLHLGAYAFFLSGGTVDALLEDLAKRPYIFAGFSALLLLVPLAVTSTRRWQRRLGPRWKRLHRLVYPIAGLAVLHVAWLAKASYLLAVCYGVWFALLMIERLWMQFGTRIIRSF
ncbi:MAG: sulfoxide reductase heme-binding subunit YedZ [Gammaproteobacteria bacterium]|nr:sulfoxide reductase heme-binding subunit YedZ [Gammaproteobacteria bacterium]